MVVSFKDFKDDLSQAVNDIVDEEKETEAANSENMEVNTLESEDSVDMKTELAKLDGLLEQVSAKKEEPQTQPAEEKKPAGPTAEEIMQFMKSKETKHEEAAVMSTEETKTTNLEEEFRAT